MGQFKVVGGSVFLAVHVQLPMIHCCKQHGESLIGQGTKPGI